MRASRRRAQALTRVFLRPHCGRGCSLPRCGAVSTPLITPSDLIRSPVSPAGSSRASSGLRLIRLADGFPRAMRAQEPPKNELTQFHPPSTLPLSNSRRHFDRSGGRRLDQRRTSRAQGRGLRRTRESGKERLLLFLFARRRRRKTLSLLQSNCRCFARSRVTGAFLVL